MIKAPGFLVLGLHAYPSSNRAEVQPLTSSNGLCEELQVAPLSAEA